MDLELKARLVPLIEEAAYNGDIEVDDSIVYDQEFQRRWTEAGGDWELLLSIIADNIVIDTYEPCADGDDDVAEVICWDDVETDYFKNLTPSLPSPTQAELEVAGQARLFE